MNVSGIVATILAADGTANGLLSGRVYPGRVKQEAGYPAAAVTLISPGATDSKTQVSDTDFTTAQISVFGSTYSSAVNTAAAIRNALDFYSGTVTLTGGGTEDVALISYSSEMDGFEDRPDVYTRICEYIITIKR